MVFFVKKTKICTRFLVCMQTEKKPSPFGRALGIMLYQSANRGVEK